MDFRSIYEQGFARIAACTAPVAVADPAANAQTVLRVAGECAADGVAVALFPELCLTGYSIEDLLHQDAVLDGAEQAVATVVEGSAELPSVLIVGAPLRHRNRIYNCAVVIHRGRALGVAPKSYMPTYREFYEGRQVASGVGEGGEIRVNGTEVPFGPDLLFAAEDVPGLVIHVEVCEDVWIPIPPSSEAALAGATVLFNPSGSPITVGRAEDRKLMCRSQSSRCLAAYVYAAAGEGESTTDLSWDGQTMIYENGVLLAETERFPDSERRSIADVDLDLLRQERMRMGTFDDNRRAHSERLAGFRRIGFELGPPGGDLGLRRKVERFPFVPADPARLEQDCYEAYNIQVAGLQRRLQAIGGETKVVIGVSGGLDSTHALIVAAKAMDRIGRPRTDILGFTLPGFATSEGTKANAIKLDARPRRDSSGDRHHRDGAAHARGDRPSVRARGGGLRRHLRERAGRAAHRLPLPHRQPARGDRARHRRPLRARARLGDLRRWRPDEPLQRQRRRAKDADPAPDPLGRELGAVRRDRRRDARPRSSARRSAPSSCPGDELQSTEAHIGPYALHDFTLFHVLRYGFRPTKIGFLASHAWRDAEAGDGRRTSPRERPYEEAEIRKWLEFFCERFFAFAQFKRSAMPNGPKVSHGGSLSPRGDWRAPSDGTAAAWLRDLERWTV